MKIIIELSKDMEQKISELIRGESFKNFNHFIEVACRNQLMAEGGEVAWATPVPHSESEDLAETETYHLHKAHKLIELPSHEVVTSASIDETSVAFSDQPLWGQYYRFLPMIAGLRVLTNLCSHGPVEIKVFHEAAARAARRFRLHLENLDRHNDKKVGEKLATSFPTGKKASLKRYTSQFLVDVRSTDGRMVGLMARLLFASVEIENATYRVVPTPAGLEFAMLFNPVIDGNDPRQPLSDEESRFLLKHICRDVEVECSHMLRLLESLRDGPSGGEDLNDRMRTYYSAFQRDGSKWSDAMVNTMRSGVTSRLSEVGLVTRTHPKRGSPLMLTQMGTEWLDARRDGTEVEGD